MNGVADRKTTQIVLSMSESCGLGIGVARVVSASCATKKRTTMAFMTRYAAAHPIIWEGRKSGRSMPGERTLYGDFIREAD